MDSNPVMLRIEAVSQSYDGERWQLRNLDFDLRAGQITAILGPNGRANRHCCGFWRDF